MKLLQDLNREEIGKILEGEPKFRADQLYEAINNGASYAEMTNLPQALRLKLQEEYSDNAVEIYQTFVASDGTKKYLYKLSDGNIVEGVLMNYTYGNTLCISTQVGCRMGCTFCASGIDGLIRNMTAGEMLGEIIAVNKRRGGTVKNREVTNVVLMGSGEPLDNYDNVAKFLMLTRDGLKISPRNISLSTSGIVPNIYKLAEETGVTLTISLHAPNDAKRNELMPVGNKYGIKELMKAAKYYIEKTGRRVIFEYIMLSGINDGEADALELANLVKGMQAHINLINLNYVKEKKLIPSSKNRTNEFLDRLIELGVSATVRRSMGSDVSGACGQLRRSVVEREQI